MEFRITIFQIFILMKEYLITFQKPNYFIFQIRIVIKNVSKNINVPSSILNPFNKHERNI